MGWCETHKIEYPSSKGGCPKCEIRAKVKKWDKEETEKMNELKARALKEMERRKGGDA